MGTTLTREESLCIKKILLRVIYSKSGFFLKKKALTPQPNLTRNLAYFLVYEKCKTLPMLHRF